MGTFESLHSKVQAYIYKQKWESFRPIQDEAILHLSKTENGNLLICAQTASGKTEAAFLPIVSAIAENFDGSYRALYISPLKALINDQFRRIDELCKDIGIPVTKWHGDVGQNIKSKSLSDPKGILLITPESIEATLLTKIAKARGAFSKLQFIVIDEIHSFVGTERGAQLRSLIFRIEEESKVKPILIALSATVGNPEEVGKWMSGDRAFRVIEDSEWKDSNSVVGLIKGFTSKVKDDQQEDESVSLLSPGFTESIYLSFLNGKNLIFGNSKKKLEETAYSVKQIALSRNSSTQFLIHHGSLAKETRETAEAEVKGAARPTSVFCTSTLEMGVDIGSIEKVGIIDPPWSVAGFAQRIGRSGRREGSSKKFEFFINQMEVDEDSNLGEILREDLVKSIAVVLLYLDEFIEPLETKGLHMSTMVHQILSLVVQKSGISFGEIKRVILDGSFRGVINDQEFGHLIAALIENNMLHKEDAGVISAGTVGEKLVEHYEFYGVFLTSDQWSVVNDGQTIGEIPIVGSYRPNDHILLGGRVWLIREVIEPAKRLIVVPAKKAKAPVFSASFGLTHKMIHQKMLEIYSSDDEYKFINPEASRLLAEGRVAFSNLQKAGAALSNRIPVFEGTVIQNTISCLLSLAKIEHGISEICLEIKGPAGEWRQKLKDAIGSFKSNLHLASVIPRAKKQVEKYDRFLPIELLDQVYAKKYLDLDGVRAWLERVK